jgi:hypothetical protein
MSFAEDLTSRLDNPLDAVADMAMANDWSFERGVDDEITLVVGGGWANYQISFTWMRDIEVLHLACAFELRVPEARRTAVRDLVISINEQLWIGHFDVWMQNAMVMFRHALLLVGGTVASREQCEAALGSAVDSCERYYPAFQYVTWPGKSARDAMDRIMFETAGQA